MKFIVIGVIDREIESNELNRLEQAESKFFVQLYQCGVLQQMFVCRAWNCQFLILECNSRAEATQFLERLPGSKTKIFRYSIADLKQPAALIELCEAQNLNLPDWMLA